ncbi:MAG: sugar phosphate isomerase/epimerase [Spirochaetota bacterium]|nr:MAG: sugar phosphate isomerase/epimerase [Spirochaetota bacterium]
MKQIKIGVCQWAFPLEGPYSCIVASQLGLEGVELELGEYEHNFPISNKMIQGIYREVRDEYGIEYPSIAVNALLKNSMNNEETTEKGKIARLAIQRAVETADALGIPVIQLPSFIDGEIKSDEDFERTVDCLRYACGLVEGKNITIATENLLSSNDNKRILEKVDRPQMKIFFDLQNYSLFQGYNTQEMLEDLAPYICEVHAKDGKEHMSGALLGTGDAGFFESVKILKKIGYSGWIYLENYYDQYPLNSTGKDPFDLIKQDIKIIREAFAL